MMDKSRKEIIRGEARRAKAIPVAKYTAGDLAGANKFVVKAKILYPKLCGFLYLNPVLDVRMCVEKKLNGEVDWYAFFSIYPTENLINQKCYCKLFKAISCDRDNYAGRIDETKKIFADAWKYFYNAK
ncbi:hypothetical protein V5N11_017802 [Cardamine amara subsp. amara]|uniref:Uncharacterized protein n=1 Tax=Cardamine amara subsp. amara TaxID=228776 RepID=A0ABD1ACG3_CARAN